MLSASIGSSSSQDIVRIIDDIRTQLFHTEKLVLMGKSWGGMQAQNYVESHPLHVAKLVLVAPAKNNPKQIQAIKSAGVPVLLMWARDDRAINFSNAATWSAVFGREGDGSRLVFLRAEKGGHAVLKEYSGKILKFLTGQQLKSDEFEK